MSKAIIFDFDGTLVDSQSLIYECFEEATRIIAPNRIEMAKNIIIGPQLRESVKVILGDKLLEKVDIFIEKFIDLHDKNVVKKCCPFPMANEVLDVLFQKKLSMAIATNKRTFPTISLIEHFGWSKYFTFIECSDSKEKNRTKIDMIYEIVQEPSFKFSYYVGDTLADGLSAQANNLPFIRANYGYGEKDEWSKVNIYKSINTIDELLASNIYE